MHKQQGWPQALEYCQAKLIHKLGRASQGDNWSWSQCIKSHHAQTFSGKGLPSHFWNRDNVRSVLPGLWRKKNWTVAQWSKFLFSDERKCCISFWKSRSQSLEEEWRGIESMLLEVSIVSDDLGCHVIFWYWSTVFFEVYSQCSHLPEHFRALHASFGWQAL